MVHICDDRPFHEASRGRGKGGCNGTGHGSVRRVHGASNGVKIGKIWLRQCIFVSDAASSPSAPGTPTGVGTDLPHARRSYRGCPATLSIKRRPASPHPPSSSPYGSIRRLPARAHPRNIFTRRRGIAPQRGQIRTNRTLRQTFGNKNFAGK